MAKRSVSDQLNDALEAMMANPGAPPARLPAKLAALLRLAGDLRDLPRDDFKARLANELNLPPDDGGGEVTPQPTPHVRPVPEGYHTATPCLVLRDPGRGIAFYKAAFGATERMRLDDPSGNVVHAEIQIGDSCIAI